MKSVIVIINYNQGELLNKQLWCLRAFCSEIEDIVVIDNGSHPDKSVRIKYWAIQHGATLWTTRNSESDPSRAHGFGCNLAWHKLKDHYDLICFLDHDMFPYRPFDMVSFMEDKAIAGCPQTRHGIKYYWPGLTFINTQRIDKSNIDFMPCEVNGVFLDTGGGCWRAVENTTRTYDFHEVYVKDKLYNHSKYDFYSVFDDTFMHFIKASNWSGEVPESDSRVSGLLVQLDEHINA